MPAKVKNELIYFISGMWCSTCAKSISESVVRLDGVSSAHVNYSTKLLLVKTEASSHTLAPSLDLLIQDKVSRIGFGIKKQTQNWLQYFQEDLQNEVDQKITWVQVGVVWFLAMWSSMLGLASYMGGLLESEIYYLSVASAALGLPAVFIGAWPYAQSGLRALIYSRWLTLDFFIFIGAIAATCVTLYSLFTRASISYADSSAMILAILLLTKKLENIFAHKATAKILFQIQPEQDQILVFKKQKWVLADTHQVRSGDIIKVKENQTLPLDGQLESPTAQINNHLLSGEDTPISLKMGDEVLAGAIANSEMQIRVTSPQGQRRVDEWAEKALLAENHKAGLQRIFIKLEQHLVILAFSGALLIAGSYIYRSAPLTKVIESFFVGILIFCPCLFASILPLAKRWAHFALFNKGILLSRSDALLDLCSIQRFYFDKTGTLENVESQFVAFENKDFILPYLKELSIKSRHIILRELKELDAVLPKPFKHITEIPGQGLKAKTTDGDLIILGRPSFLRAQNIVVPSSLWDHGTYVALNHQVVGYILLQKNFNASAKSFLKHLLTLFPHLEVKILSGDPSSEAQAKYTTIDSRIQYQGDLSPEGKGALIKPRSAFLGDGINDIMALAHAQVSLRLGHRATGLVPVDIYFTRPHLSQILTLLTYAHKYKKILIQTGLAALVYNVVAISLALYGAFSPLGAVIAMALSFSLMLLSVFRLQFLEEVQS